MAAPVVSRFQLVITAILFSTGGAAVKACTLTGWQVACFRSGVAALAILLLVPAARRRWTWRTVVVGAVYATTLILYVNANKLTTAANAIFLQSTAPLYAALLAPWLLREPMRRRDLVFMVALAAGMALFFLGGDAPSTSAPDPARGNLLGAGAGLFWAFTIIGLRAEGKTGDVGSAPAAAVAGNVLAFLFCMPMALPVESSAPTDWAVIAYLGVFQVGLAYALLTSAVRHVPALEAALILLIEPVLNPLWAWAFQSEMPAGASLAGCGVILVATGIRTWLDARRLRPPG